MIKTVNLNVAKNSKTYMINAPKQCPYCQVVMRPIVDTNLITMVKYNSTSVMLVVLRAPCCEKHFFVTYEVGSSSYPTLLYSYPQITSSQLPEVVTEMSPRFAQLYGQSYTAEMNGHIELAGSGYRNAIEVLIKDFAIEVLKVDRQEVVKKSLYDAIGAYIDSKQLQNCADVIRLLGNDRTHYVAKYEGVDFETLKKYVDIFINTVENEIMIRQPVIPVNRSEKQALPEPQPLIDTKSESAH